MQAGFAHKTITPVNAMPMAGYDKRRVLFEGVHDDIYVKCLFLNEGGEVIAIISLDLLGVDDMLTDAVIEALRACDERISHERMLICATHTHSGPSGIFKEKVDFNEEYYRFLVESCKDVYFAAKKDFKPGVLQIASTRIDNVASVRNTVSPESKGIKAQVIKVIRDDGCILLVNLACHPTVLDENNLYISKDLLFGLELGLKESGIERSIFINGAAANISTRYIKKAASFAESERLGRIIAKKITVLNYEIVPDPIISAEKRSILLRYKKNLSSIEKEEKRSVIRKLLTKAGDSPLKKNYESSLLILDRPERDFKVLHNTFASGDDWYREVVVKLVKAGSLAFACVPLEISIETGEKIRSILSTEIDKVLIIGYCGGYSGYIAGAESGQFDYENIACPYESDSEYRLLETFKSFAVKAM